MACSTFLTVIHLDLPKHVKDHISVEIFTFSNLALIHRFKSCMFEVNQFYFVLSSNIAPLVGALGTRLDAEYSVGYRLVLR